MKNDFEAIIRDEFQGIPNLSLSGSTSVGRTIYVVTSPYTSFKAIISLNKLETENVTDLDALVRERAARTAAKLKEALSIAA